MSYANGDPMMAQMEQEEEMEYDTGDAMITAEDCWTVIHSFFDAKGLVSQQIDSFDEFASTTMQEIVDETPPIVIDANIPPEEEETGMPIVKRRYIIKLSELSMSQAAMTEGDGSTRALYPHEARLRNLTYSSPTFWT